MDEHTPCDSTTPRQDSTGADREPPNRRGFLAEASTGALGLIAASTLAASPRAGAEQAPKAAPVDLKASLAVTSQLVQFVHEAEQKLRDAHLEKGTDLEPRLKEAGVKIPDWLQGSGLIAETATAEAMAHGKNDLVIVLPGDPRILEIRIFCICIRKWNVCICLECGFFWCRIVIRGTF